MSQSKQKIEIFSIFVWANTFRLEIYHYHSAIANPNSHFSVSLIIRGEGRVLHSETKWSCFILRSVCDAMLHPPSPRLWRTSLSRQRLFFYEARLTPHEACLPPPPRLRRTSRHMKHLAAMPPNMKRSLDRLHVFLPVRAKKMVGMMRFELTTF